MTANPKLIEAVQSASAAVRIIDAAHYSNAHGIPAPWAMLPIEKLRTIVTHATAGVIGKAIALRVTRLKQVESVLREADPTASKNAFNAVELENGLYETADREIELDLVGRTAELKSLFPQFVNEAGDVHPMREMMDVQGFIEEHFMTFGLDLRNPGVDPQVAEDFVNGHDILSASPFLHAGHLRELASYFTLATACTIAEASAREIYARFPGHEAFREFEARPPEILRGEEVLRLDDICNTLSSRFAVHAVAFSQVLDEAFGVHQSTATARESLPFLGLN